MHLGVKAPCPLILWFFAERIVSSLINQYGGSSTVQIVASQNAVQIVASQKIM
jgi:hypothetical protein